MFYYLHRCPVNIILEHTADTLILGAKPRHLGSPLFYTGAILFIVSMLTRGFLANAISRAAVIPLGLSTLILISAIWHFSAIPKAVFSVVDGKLFIIYKHLGYLQKVYTFSLANIENAEQLSLINNHHLLRLRKDNQEYIWLAKGKEDYTVIVTAINTLLNSFEQNLIK